MKKLQATLFLAALTICSPASAQQRENLINTALQQAADRIQVALGYGAWARSDFWLVFGIFAFVVLVVVGLILRTVMNWAKDSDVYDDELRREKARRKIQRDLDRR